MSLEVFLTALFIKLAKLSIYFICPTFGNIFCCLCLICCVLSCYDDFFGDYFSIVVEYKEVYAALLASQVVFHKALWGGFQAEPVESYTLHIIYVDVDLAFRFSHEETHRSVVGVGYHVYVKGIETVCLIVVYAIE